MSSEEETKPEEAGEATAQERPPAEAEQPPPQPVDVYAMLRFCIAQLAAVAWQKMGLQADPLTKAIHKDVEQARIAIDCTTALAQKLMPHLEGQEARDYQSLLNDLRLNFLNQSQS